LLIAALTTPAKVAVMVKRSINDAIFFFIRTHLLLALKGALGKGISNYRLHRIGGNSPNASTILYPFIENINILSIATR
jgi:hypothetical protein